MPFDSSAQDEGNNSIPLDHFYVKPRHGSNVIRRALRNFHFGLYTGLGRTYFKTQLNEFGIYQPPGSLPEILTRSSANRYTNWVTDVGVDSSALGSYTVANPGTANLGFKGHALNIPLAEIGRAHV